MYFLFNSNNIVIARFFFPPFLLDAESLVCQQHPLVDIAWLGSTLCQSQKRTPPTLSRQPVPTFPLTISANDSPGYK